MDKESMIHDFAYYKRTIETIYKRYYQKMLMGLTILLVVAGMLFYVGASKSIVGMSMVLILGSIGFVVNRYKTLPRFMEDEEAFTSLAELSEDSNYYYIPKEQLKFSKKHSRNLTSQKRGITFFIGVQPFNIFNPVYIRYYDMLEMTYTEKFKLTKNNVSYARSRWKYRMKSWVAAIPAVLFFVYLFFFRLSFIGSAIMRMISAIF
ncbi:hypothetical protein [uncultured Vagococcus sp.]|uniref:hypothetical protein n=1 Tax=uncultured Vagococcus sp. TaxID=189676 RepID=UPI0028D860AF|nr:hypothetical protein [uncultured Vagococcus sp.]